MQALGICMPEEIKEISGLCRANSELDHVGHADLKPMNRIIGTPSVPNLQPSFSVLNPH